MSEPLDFSKNIYLVADIYKSCGHGRQAFEQLLAGGLRWQGNSGNIPCARVRADAADASNVHLGHELLHFVQEGIGVARRVVADYLLREAGVDDGNALHHAGAGLRRNLLDLLQSSCRHEQTTRPGVAGQHLEFATFLIVIIKLYLSLYSVV